MYFLWVFLLKRNQKRDSKCTNRTKKLIKNTSNHQNFMSMESKNRWHLTGGWVLRKFMKRFFFYFLWFFNQLKRYKFAILYSLSQKKGLNKLLKIVQNIKLEKKLNQILVRPKTGMGKIEKFKNTFFPYFLWVFLLLTANKSVKFVLKSKIKNTSNHQNFMSME